MAFTNNTITQNSTSGVSLDSASLSMTNSIIPDEIHGTYHGDKVNLTYSYTGQDPQFIDPSNGDYHLQPTSPCKNASDPDPQYNDPDGTRNDMGAYGSPGRRHCRRADPSLSSTGYIGCKIEGVTIAGEDYIE